MVSRVSIFALSFLLTVKLVTMVTFVTEVIVFLSDLSLSQLVYAKGVQALTWDPQVSDSSRVTPVRAAYERITKFQRTAQKVSYSFRIPSIY